MLDDAPRWFDWGTLGFQSSCHHLRHSLDRDINKVQGLDINKVHSNIKSQYEYKNIDIQFINFENQI